MVNIQTIGYNQFMIALHNQLLQVKGYIYIIRKLQIQDILMSTIVTNILDIIKQQVLQDVDRLLQHILII